MFFIQILYLVFKLFLTQISQDGFNDDGLVLRVRIRLRQGGQPRPLLQGRPEVGPRLPHPLHPSGNAPSGTDLQR